MMRCIILLLITALTLGSCGSYNSIDNFYEAHKNDAHVTAVRVPKFMLSLLSGINPEMGAILGNTKDLRYMSLPSSTKVRTKLLNDQMNSFTSGSFIEVFRKNNELKRNILAIREKGNSVKEIILYKNNEVNGSFLYFNGNFDPILVKQMAENEQFQNLESSLLSKVAPATPSIIIE